jgi:small subunit ribosomal protein S3
MLKTYFVNQSIKEVEMQSFIKSQFPQGDYSDIILQRTPLGLKIVIYTNKPGKIIGRGGRNIDMINDALKAKFNLENPQPEIKLIDNPNVDAKIVAKQITSALEQGYNYKKIGNMMMKKIMRSGALGAQIVIAGKLGGSKGRTAKFSTGLMKHCGWPSKHMVSYGFEEALTKPGKIGVQVRIMCTFLDITGEIKNTLPGKKKEDVAIDSKESETKVEIAKTEKAAIEGLLENDTAETSTEIEQAAQRPAPHKVEEAENIMKQALKESAAAGAHEHEKAKAPAIERVKPKARKAPAKKKE